MLADMQSAKSFTSSAAAAAASAPEPLAFPLSFAQERLWFMDKLEPGASVYNVPEAFRLKGSLNTIALERSIKEIVRRHESLRTTFAEVDGEPVQIVAPQPNPDFAITDLSHLPPAEREREAVRCISDDANRPFDLEQGPLLRVLLVRLAKHEHVLFINMHHIVSEGGWSMGVFLRELNALYNSFAAGQPSPLRDLEIQYGDYATWQREWLQGNVLDELLAFWKTQLQGAPSLLELPLDHPRPANQTYNGSRESLLLPASLQAALQCLSNNENITLFTTVLAAFKTLLFRYTRQEDLLVGVPVAGRNSPEVHELIGFFVNTLVLRTDLSGDPTFRELLQRVRRVCSQAQAHDETPFEGVVEAIGPDRTLAYSPLFQVMFAYQNAPRDALDLTGLVASPFEFELRTSMFDLRLFLWERPDGLLATMEYNTDLFDRATIQRLLGHFRALVEGAVANPDEHVSRLPLITEQERRTLLVDWNNTAKEYPAVCLHEAFEKQVERDPGKIALIFGSHKLTYGELNDRANQLARHLGQQGVTPGSLVGLFLERSPEMVVAIYGILKAGAAYVPFDTELPVSRLTAMLDDSKPALVITQGRLLDKVSPHTSRVLAIDSDWSDIATQLNSNPGTAVGGCDPIYAIYTSGSTGMPKAAVNTHAAVANRIFWMQDQYGLTLADRVLLKTPYTFDVSVWEFFTPLIAGATLVIAEPDGHRDPAYLVDVIEKTRITAIHFVPSMLREFLNADNLERCRSLRRVICSGEALSRELQEAFFQRFSASLLNLYGPTEAAVDVTHWECRRDSSRTTVPIGKPISNVKMHVLDPHLLPVPIGVPGELHIGGVALAQGYLNRPKLTAEKFIADPFGNSPKARLYKTGDLARYLPDGNIEYLGRIDNQIKLRGLRIELGEIESVLAEHPDVEQAVAGVKQTNAGDQLLVAHVVSRSTPKTTPGELRGYLKDKLPNYMVPSAFVVLDQFPLTPSGKVDRRSLPPPDARSYEASDATAPADQAAEPRNLIELQLVNIWEKLLGRAPIGVKDDFFALGGHSLLAVRMLSRVQKALGQRLSIETIFRQPTIEELAKVLSGQDQSSWRSVVPLQPTGSKPPLFCIPGGGGNLLAYRDLIRHLPPDQPCYGLQPPCLEGTQAHHSSIQDTASYYIQQMQLVQPSGPYNIEGWCVGGLIAFEMARQLSNKGHEVGLVLLIDTACPSGRIRFRSRIAYHRKTMLSRAGFARAMYVAQELRRIIGSQFFRARKLLVSLRIRLYREVKVAAPHELMEDYVLVKDYDAAQSYRPQGFEGRLTIFWPTESPEEAYTNSRAEWERLASGGAEHHDFPGGHVSMLQEPMVSRLARTLTECLDRAYCQSSAVVREKAS